MRHTVIGRGADHVISMLEHVAGDSAEELHGKTAREREITGRDLWTFIEFYLSVIDAAPFISRWWIAMRSVSGVR